MADITAMVGLIAGAKNAIDIVRFLKNSKVSLDDAENQLKLADLMTSLAEMTIQFADIKILLAEKDQRIKELDEAFQSKDSLIRALDAYYEVGPDGNPIGEPYCMRCWQENHKKYYLHEIVGAKKYCAVCKTEYLKRRTEMCE